ncbi:hypothetical protein TNCV_1240721 [Trichonephila clavipes]|uniref:Uncharacterized protein n=1 Tax=Trichonephila clavipes TaxID=2585209 RepID=A0A8X6WFT7_TRICX|nr:hypothetical protein TNCV_1240721 [Trichonephila clavipes]
MLWLDKSFLGYCMGSFIRMEECLNAQGYISVIADQVQPVIGHSRDITSLGWHAESPDLNLIEKLWNEIERRIKQLDPESSNRRHWKVQFITYGLILFIPSTNLYCSYQVSRRAVAS